MVIAPVVQDGEGGGRRPEEDDPSVQLRIEVPAVAIAVEVLLHLRRDAAEINSRYSRDEIDATPDVSSRDLGEISAPGRRRE